MYSMENISIYGHSIRTNNDFEGYHYHLKEMNQRS